MKKLLSSAIIYAVLVSGANVEAAASKVKNSNSSNKEANKVGNNKVKKLEVAKKTTKDSSSSGKKDGILGYTNGKWKTNATAVLGLNTGIEIRAHYNTDVTGGSFSGPGVNLGIGYQFTYAFKTHYSLYGNVELQYDFISGLAEHIVDKMSFIGAKFHFGFAFMEEKFKSYFTVGFMGIISSVGSFDRNGFAPFFGVGLSQDIIKRRLAAVLEFEGGPVVGVDTLSGFIIMRLGIRGTF